MTLRTGTCLGPYKFAALPSVGRKGEVYKAYDVSLDRDDLVEGLR